MTTTSTPGITVLSDGRRFIDKRHLGVCIGLRVGAVTQEQAEERCIAKSRKIHAASDPEYVCGVHRFRR